MGLIGSCQSISVFENAILAFRRTGILACLNRGSAFASMIGLVGLDRPTLTAQPAGGMSRTSKTLVRTVWRSTVRSLHPGFPSE